MAGTQPLNKLAPFEILDDHGNTVIQIDPNGVLVQKIIFSDGSYIVATDEHRFRNFLVSFLVSF